MSQVRRNGIALFYQEAGGGELPLVFVHGWCCDHTYFASQFEHFRRKHRVVTVDLRGHGQLRFVRTGAGKKKADRQAVAVGDQH